MPPAGVVDATGCDAAGVVDLAADADVGGGGDVDEGRLRMKRSRVPNPGRRTLFDAP